MVSKREMLSVMDLLELNVRIEAVTQVISWRGQDNVILENVATDSDG